jgi:hypothetical protein
MRYYGDGEEAARDLTALPAKPTESIVVSSRSHYEGRNLQAYSRNLVMPMSSASTMQQLIGRTHRLGQQADTVTVDMFWHTKHIKECWATSLTKAEHIDKLKNEPQRIIYGDRTWQSES